MSDPLPPAASKFSPRGGAVFVLAKKQNLKTFMFPGEPAPIKLISAVGYFITMTPGYAGRQELPENLKAQFRGMWDPRNQEITARRTPIARERSKWSN